MALRRNLAAVVCLAFGSLMVVAQETKTPATSRTLVRAGHLPDVKTGKLLDAQTMVVSGDVRGRHRLGQGPAGRYRD
jgi:hypothetical protein